MKNKVTHTIVFACCVFFLSYSGVAMAKTIFGPGTCDEWNESHKSKDDSFSSIALHSWLNGYLTGINMMVSEKKDLLAKVDPVTAADWVSRYCLTHPKEGVDEAAMEFIAELIKRKIVQ